MGFVIGFIAGVVFVPVAIVGFVMLVNSDAT